ncbi:hypothetical protein [Desulfatibacillum aliphaticivorans]|uniref:Uncharacterized protein n=1 Tax=Desulfatibacillum aliphaticivorans TaxID=218208 RepID=B8FN27_DESAL|nr:hypothetical protein [Desulfatibacillum aliphaticivorans]ACL05897.1 conserved hypothetical protein [Desulfatibacillum aliphaticivorans]
MDLAQLEAIYSTQLSIPMYQIGLLLLISTLALLFGRIKVALINNYLFALYWGYILNRAVLVGDNLENVSYFTALYFGFGIIIAIFAVVGFMTHSD